MDKDKFERELFDVLQKYGYKTDGIQRLEMSFEIDELPRLDIQYLYVE